MARRTDMLKNFNSSFLQLCEGTELKHVNAGDSISSGLVRACVCVCARARVYERERKSMRECALTCMCAHVYVR
jgi:hypothetical protein